MKPMKDSRHYFVYGCPTGLHTGPTTVEHHDILELPVPEEGTAVAYEYDITFVVVAKHREDAELYSREL